MNKPEQPEPRIEDSLADAIAGLWGDLDSRAAGEASEETKKNEALLLSWAGKLADILKGPPR